jgi:hypothetical protein
MGQATGGNPNAVNPNAVNPMERPTPMSHAGSAPGNNPDDQPMHIKVDEKRFVKDAIPRR